MSTTKQKRARTEDTPTRTLHDFFNAKAIAVRTTTPAKNLAKPGKPLKTNVQAKGNTLAQEVIIIDSDSDDDMPEIVEVAQVQATSVKRRKLSPRNWDDPPQAKAQISTSVEISSHSKENASTISTNRTVCEVKKEGSMFGNPILLCSHPTSKHVDSRGATVSYASSSTIIDSLESIGIAGDAKKEAEVDIDLTLDFWDNGDDELGQEANRVLEATDADVPDELVDVLKAEDEADPWTYGMSVDRDDQFLHFESEGVIPSEQTAGPSKLVPTQTATKASSTDNPSTPNAFSFLMSSFKEKEAWKEADVASDPSFRATGSTRRKAPFYKVLQGMPIAVDAFKYGAIPGVTAYFLTHAHSDHYTNLSSSWKHGPIYCSVGTANLIKHMLSVPASCVHPLPMDVPTLIPNTNGVHVTLIVANHCPGSCLFMFEGPQSVDAGDSTYKSKWVKEKSNRVWRYLHCGDFRASPRHAMHPAVKGKRIDHVYLDTTYLDPKYTFPPQPLVISACADLVAKLVDGDGTGTGSNMLSWLGPSKDKGKRKEKSRPLIVVGTYSIGKERIVKAIAHALHTKVYCDTRKAAILRCQADSELDALLTNNPEESIVHLVPLATITSDRLKLYLERFNGIYDHVIGFRPTGWTYTPTAGATRSPSIAAIVSSASSSSFTHADLNPSPKSSPNTQLYPVPYSEHSSFNELTCFAMSFSWTKMIATVNVGSESSRAKMSAWFSKWEKERKKRGVDQVVGFRHIDYW